MQPNKTKCEFATNSELAFLLSSGFGLPTSGLRLPTSGLGFLCNCYIFIKIHILRSMK
jgi:hypothetical protein